MRSAVSIRRVGEVGTATAHLIDHGERLRSVEALEDRRAIIAHPDGRGLWGDEHTHTQREGESLSSKEQRSAQERWWETK